MANKDSTLLALPALLQPQKEDILLVCDHSAGYDAKKMSLDALIELVYASSDAFDVTPDGLTLKQNLDANHHKITNLQAGISNQDAVNYGQVKHLLQDLEGVDVTTPSIKEVGAYIEVGTAPVTTPAGGFYIYYWCVDDSPSTQISLEGAGVVASSGAPIQLDSAVANIVKIPKSAGMKDQYFHVAVRYRNMGSLSALSSTVTVQLDTSIFEDVFSPLTFLPPTNLSAWEEKGTLYIKANPAEGGHPGTTYRAELLFAKGEPRVVQGNEADLITLVSHDPVFAYNLPMWSAGEFYASVRIAAVSVAGHRVYSAQVNVLCDLRFSVILQDDKTLEDLASVIGGMLQTVSGEPLIAQK